MEMDPKNYYYTSGGDESAKRNHLYWLLPLLLVVVLCAGSAFLYFQQSQQEQQNEPTKTIPPDPFADLRGSVYLTLAPVEGDRGGGNMADTNEYLYDIKTGEMSEAIPEDDSVKITSGLSPSATLLAYMSSPYDPDAPADYFYPVTEFSQLHIYDYETGEVRELTDQRTMGKRNPEWSPDGEQIVYYSYEFEDGPVPRDPDVWQMDIVDLDGNRETIGNGAQPFWSPDGDSLLYVKEDGIYLYDTRTETHKQVYELSTEPLTTLMKYDLSDDGTRFAWTDPLGNRITVYDITSWEPFEIHPLEEFEVIGYAATYWPTFSPDNKYLIAQWGGYDEETNESRNFQLVAYSLLTGEHKTLMSLEPYRFDASFISDWIY